jgi:hypothetical protein
MLFALPTRSLAQGGPPVITAQPQSQTNNAGTTATFSVAVSSVTQPAYQWKFNGGNVSGATSTSYSITNVQASNAGSYSVAITNLVGYAISSNAILTVLVPPTITNQPLNRTVAAGSTAIFTVGATGTQPLSYGWRFNGVSIPGATGSSLTLTNVQSANAGSYTTLVTNSAGSATSQPGVLTIFCGYSSSLTGSNVGISPDPQEPTNCGIPPCHPFWVNYTAQASGQLTISTRGTTFNAVLAVYTGPSILNLTPVACSQGHGAVTGETVSFSALSGTTYHVVVDGLSCASGSFTESYSLAVSPAFTNSPLSQSVAPGGAVTLTGYSAGISLTYQWRFNGADLTGKTNTSLTLMNFQAGNEGTYTIVAMDGCGASAESAPAALYLNNPLRVMNSAVSNGFFSCQIIGAANTNYIIQATTNFTVWVPVKTNNSQFGILNYVDPNTANFPRRFYRAFKP